MAAVELVSLLESRRVWRGRRAVPAADGEPSGWPALDALLPGGGWPRGALSEILLPGDGVGELRLVLPVLARLTRAGRNVMVVAPPYCPHAPAWAAQGLDLARVGFVRAAPGPDALWAAEQCLRAGSVAAVLAWPRAADERVLRRLQVAAATGDALGFVFRDRGHAAAPSPAPLRLELLARERLQIHVRKCRGAQPPARPLAADWLRSAPAGSCAAAR